MKQNNLKISQQIYLWVGFLLLILFGFVTSTYFLMEALWQNTQSLYEHPLTVRQAVGAMEVDALTIHNLTLHLVDESDISRGEVLIKQIDSLEADAYRQLEILYDRYLGSTGDLDAISDSLAQWNTIRSETFRLYRTGDLAQTLQRVSDSGVDGAQANQTMTLLSKVSEFAKNKGDEFYSAALATKDSSLLSISLLSIGVLLTSLVAGFMLRRGILPPLRELTGAAKSMQQGQLNTRVTYTSTNEIGILSNTFNKMADTIETEMEYKESLSRVSTALSNATDLRSFSRELIKILMQDTDSQLGAVYLLNDQKKVYEPFESIGAKQGSLRSFSATASEGEFGAAVVARSIRHISEIPDDVAVVYSSVSGDYRVKDLLTIPIVSGSDVILILSLASIKHYTPESMRLVHGIYNEITARITALSAWQKVLDMSERIQAANQELQQQAKELEMQTRELTEQNTELELQKKQLDAASRMKTNFLSNMSHELRTPLNSVIALTGVLRRRLTDRIPEEEFSFLEVIERNGKGLLTLINDILDISRIEAGREEIEIETFGANALVQDVVEMIRPQAEQSGIELIHEPSAEIRISSDMNKLRHILQNLIGNAVKFTEKGSVRVSVSAQNRELTVRVLDTGIGISTDELPFIFDEFRQADSSTSRRFGGAGLGLAISKKYAELLGGTICAKSTLGLGSEFILSLPAQFDIAAMGAPEAELHHPKYDVVRPKPMQGRDYSDKSILIVEDNESAIIQMKDVIGSIGCQVLIAQNADEAFRIIGQTIPNAMILDLMMPDVDGFKVLEILRNAEVTAHVPVLILTAKQITKDELKFLKRNNIHQLIQKGDVNIQELRSSIAGMLDQQQAKYASAQPKSPAKEGAPTVLVVEDHQDNMTTIRALLEGKYTVLEAVDARECLAAVENGTPDLILMDIALPDINGIDLFHRIRTMPTMNHTPVIALTASAMRQDREVILAHGFNGFIAKPIVEKEFNRVIEGVLYGK